MNQNLKENEQKIDNVKKENKNEIEVDSKNKSEPEITPKNKEEIKKIRKEELDKILKGIEGVALKFGDAIFKITYTNVGQKRFSAECINVQ